MKLRNWTIDGFGCFHDCSLPEPLGDGLNLIIGPNEAGKSTLLDFIRYTLFGYPDGREKKRPQREPFRGGVHGGSLLYENGEEVFRVFRKRRGSDAFQLTREDGGALDAELFKTHTGHVTPSVFGNIFGFSLSELQEFDSLQGEEIENLIFSAAVGRSAARIRKVGDLLRERAEAIFKERARVGPTAIRLRSELAEVEKELADARREVKETVASRRRLETLAEEISGLRARETDLAGRIEHLRRLAQGWGDYVRLQRAAAAMAELGDLSGFPPDGRERWKSINDRVRVAEERRDESSGELEKLDGELASLPEAFPLIEFGKEAETLNERKGKYEIAVRLAEDAAARAASREEAWTGCRRELGHGWDEEMILSFDLSLFAEQEARKRLDPLLTARMALRQASERQRQLESNWDAEAGAWSEERLSEERRSLEEMRQALRERSRLDGEVRAARTELNQVEVAFVSRNPGQDNAFSGVARKGWLAVAVIGGLVAGGLFFVEEMVAGIVAAVFCVVAAGFALASRSSASSGKESNLDSLHLNRKKRLEEAIAELEQHDRQWGEKCTAAGISWPADEGTFVRLEERLISEAKRADRWRAIDSTHAETTRRQKDLEPLEAEWVAYLRERRLPADIAPDTAIAIFGKIREAAGVLRERNQAREQEAAQRAAGDAFIEDLRDFLGRLGEPADDQPDELLGHFVALRARFDEEKEKSRRRENILERRKATAEKVARAEESLAEARRARDAFLGETGAVDEVEFAGLAERFGCRLELEAEIRECENILAVVFGKKGAPPELAKAWESEVIPEWEAECEALKEEREKCSNEREEKIRQMTAIEGELERALRSDAIADLQTRAEALREQIRKELQDWLEVSAALYLLQETRSRFEAGHQPPALAEASRLFSLVTGGQYSRVLRPLESNGAGLVAITAEGRHKPLETLSRGTLEQLFLCVRLGYIRHFQQQREVHLPLLMDDVTVNFDPARLKNVFSVLAEFAEGGQQILFFSCHHGIARLSRGDSRAFELRDFSFHSLDGEGVKSKKV